MASQIAARLLPYFSYFLYAQLVLLCFAVLIGCGLVLKRIMGRASFEGDPAYDLEKVAMELNQEILRLQDLRDRLYPGGVSAVVAEANSAGPGPAVAAVSEAQIDALVESRFKKQIAEYKRTIENLNVAAAAVGKSGGGESSAELAQIRGQLETEQADHKKTRDELQSKLDHLERVVSEYQIFEEDFAFVQKFKTENEVLKKQIESGGGLPAAPAPAVTESDITSMFGEKATEPLFEAAPTPVAARPAAVEVAPALESAPAVEKASVPSFESVVETAPAAVTPEMLEAMSAESAEAFAESAAGDDRLIAEFEKLLGENKT